MWCEHQTLKFSHINGNQKLLQRILCLGSLTKNDMIKLQAAKTQQIMVREISNGHHTTY